MAKNEKSGASLHFVKNGCNVDNVNYLHFNDRWFDLLFTALLLF